MHTTKDVYEDTLDSLVGEEDFERLLDRVRCCTSTTKKKKEKKSDRTLSALHDESNSPANVKEVSGLSTV